MVTASSAGRHLGDFAEFLHPLTGARINDLSRGICPASFRARSDVWRLDAERGQIRLLAGTR